MSRSICGALALSFFVSAQTLFAGILPLTFQVPGASPSKPLIVSEYKVTDGQDLQINIHLNQDQAQELNKLTAANVGRKLVVKQGERELASPTIRTATWGQDFMVSFKNSKDLQDFRANMH
ncbi:MAG: hypothetical protein M3Q07_13080 [Pseudobdellovibrionaceae bacterium]|nr:hypothetical protein [Pseudobdellovibrionaceae bacterium]